MGLHRSAVRDVSYSSTAKTRRKRVFIRSLENATGRIKVIRRLKGLDEELAGGINFWEAMAQRYRLDLEVISGSLDNIPQSGPLVLLSNHPYGILDGLTMGRILSQTRGDFRILAHRVFTKANDIGDHILPISFDDTREAVALNLKTRQQALSYLKEGGAVGIFPGGSVSSPPRALGFPMDPVWRTFSAKMITKSGATVVPMFFEGHNSRRFQVVGHYNKTVRTALLISEFKRRLNRPVRVAIGEALDQDALEAYAKDPRAMMDFLREKTYSLSPKPVNTNVYGKDF